MTFKNFLTPERVVKLKGHTKDSAFSQLVKIICRDVPHTSFHDVLDQVWEREKSFITRLSPGIAIPHAKIDSIGQTVVAVGWTPEGIDYSANTQDTPVHLIIMIIGDSSQHLQVLSEISQILRTEGIQERIINSFKSREIYDLLTSPDINEKVRLNVENQRLSYLLFSHAIKIKEEIKARAIVLYLDVFPDFEIMGSFLLRDDVYMVTSMSAQSFSAEAQTKNLVNLPYKGLNRSNRFEISLLFLLSKNLIHKGDKVISLFGQPSSSLLDHFTITDVSKEFKLFFSLNKINSDNKELNLQVLTRLLQIALDLAQEGREGQPVGTVFVMGNPVSLEAHSQQLIANPFKGYSEEEMNILDPSLEETIKEFSRIDGAFIIRPDGVLISAGTYLRVDTAVKDLPGGLGARHTAAAAITAATDALSVCISESTRRVSLFANGQLLMTF